MASIPGVTWAQTTGPPSTAGPSGRRGSCAGITCGPEQECRLQFHNQPACFCKDNAKATCGSICCPESCCCVTGTDECVCCPSLGLCDVVNGEPICLLEGAPGTNRLTCVCQDNTQRDYCSAVNCDSVSEQEAVCHALCGEQGGSATGCLFDDPTCVAQP
jgi:hypothetical protein